MATQPGRVIPGPGDLVVSIQIGPERHEPPSLADRRNLAGGFPVSRWPGSTAQTHPAPHQRPEPDRDQTQPASRTPRAAVSPDQARRSRCSARCRLTRVSTPGQPARCRLTGASTPGQPARCRLTGVSTPGQPARPVPAPDGLVSPGRRAGRAGRPRWSRWRTPRSARQARWPGPSSGRSAWRARRGRDEPLGEQVGTAAGWQGDDELEGGCAAVELPGAQTGGGQIGAGEHLALPAVVFTRGRVRPTYSSVACSNLVMASDWAWGISP